MNNIQEMIEFIDHIPQDTAIVELAGNDSFAALLKLVMSNSIENILPVITKVPSESGDYFYYEEPLDLLDKYIKDNNINVNVMFPIFISDSDSWIETCEINDSDKFKFYTPCIRCHGMVHALRIILAKRLNGIIITGERLKHPNKFKINQTKDTFNAFDRLAIKHDIVFIRPLENMPNEEIYELLSLIGIKEAIGFKCIHSGKYNVDKNVDLKDYLDKLINDLDKIISSYDF